MVPSRDERGSLRTQTYFLLSLVAAEPVTAGNTSAFPGYERGHWSLCLQHLPDADVISWKSWIQGRPGEGWQHTNNNKDQKKTCYLSWHWGSGLALYRAKPKQFTDFWRQFLTFIPGVPHNISGRKCDTKCELTPQSYVPSVTQPSTNGFAVQGIALFDSEPAVILVFSNLPLHCILKSRTALHKDLKISRWWSLWCCVWWRSLFSA